jgi:cysteate synthase
VTARTAGHSLRCTACKRVDADDGGYLLSCCDDGLLEGVYPEQLQVREGAHGLWRFIDWLPVDTAPTDSSAEVGGVTYRSSELAAAVGLDDLWIGFNGWWPERGARCPTCTFKDLEVAPTFQRLRERDAVGVVVASAGNTGRSFAHLGGEAGFPVVVVVAADHEERIWRPGSPQAASTVVVAVQEADYNDAIDLSGPLASALGFEVEGGVRNVARRDGIGTLLLDAVETMGTLPSHYVQAVGGGPGPIGVGAMARRVRASTGSSVRLRTHLVQNDVHSPVHRAWTAGRRHLDAGDLPVGPVHAYADVLVNRAPAIGQIGGLFDVLEEADGTTRTVSAAQAEAAGALFARTEGIDIMEAPAVALAGLIDAVETGAIPPDESVLLGVTGGGVGHLAAEVELHPPSRTIRCRTGADVDRLAAEVSECLPGTDGE